MVRHCQPAHRSGFTLSYFFRNKKIFGFSVRKRPPDCGDPDPADPGPLDGGGASDACPVGRGIKGCSDTAAPRLSSRRRASGERGAGRGEERGGGLAGRSGGMAVASGEPGRGERGWSWPGRRGKLAGGGGGLAGESGVGLPREGSAGPGLSAGRCAGSCADPGGRGPAAAPGPPPETAPSSPAFAAGLVGRAGAWPASKGGR